MTDIRTSLLSIYLAAYISHVISQTPVVTQLTAPGTLLDGPFYDDINKKLYFVDLAGNAVHRVDPITKEEQILYLDQSPSFVIPVEGSENQFILSLNRDLVLLNWDFQTGYYTTCLLVTLDPYRHGNKINDGKADACGRIWTGTDGGKFPNNSFILNRAAFYRVDTTQVQSVRGDVVLSPVSFSNGLIWSLDNRFLYYIDTATRRVDVFCFNLQLGTISRRRTLFTFDEYGIQGDPDGMTIDSEGNLYVAAVGAGFILKVSPAGELLQKIAIPSIYVTSSEFGGLNFDVLFVTTLKNSTVGAPSCSLDGAVFAVTGLNATGVPSNRAVLHGFCKPFYLRS